MPHAAHLLLAAGDDAERGRLVELFERTGYRVSAVKGAQVVPTIARELKPDVAILSASLANADLCAMVEAVKAVPEMDSAPVMVIAPALLETVRRCCILAGADDIVEGPLSDTVLLARVRPLCRLATMHAEMRRRIRTAETFGVRITPRAMGRLNDSECRVVVVAPRGEAERAVRTALNGGFQIAVEPDPYRAANKVESERCDAVVAAAERLEDAEPMLYLANHLRGNPSLFNLPVLLLHGKGVLTDPGEAYQQGASLVMALPAESAAIAAGIRILVRRQKLRWNIRDAFARVHRGVAPHSKTEIYPEAFLARHLDGLVEDARHDGRHLTVALFAVRNLPDIQRRHFSDAGEMIMGKVASWVTGLIRAEDMAARINGTEMAVVLPDTSIAETETVAHRIAAILQHSDFNLTEEVMQPVRVWVDTGCAALAPGDTAATLLDRARQSRL